MKTYLWSGFTLDGSEFKDTNYEEKATIEDIKKSGYALYRQILGE